MQFDNVWCTILIALNAAFRRLCNLNIHPPIFYIYLHTCVRSLWIVNWVQCRKNPSFIDSAPPVSTITPITLCHLSFYQLPFHNWLKWCDFYANSFILSSKSPIKGIEIDLQHQNNWSSIAFHLESTSTQLDDSIDLIIFHSQSNISPAIASQIHL